MQAQHLLSSEAIQSIVSSEKYPFASHADQTGRFNRVSDAAWRERDYRRIIDWSADLGIETVSDFEALLSGMIGRSRALFAAFANESSYARWDSDTTMLFLLVLIASASDQFTVEQLVDSGWDSFFADQVLTIAKRYTLRVTIN